MANLQHERAAKHWKRPGLLKNWAAQANTRHFTSCQWLNLFYFSMNSDCGHHLQLLQCFVNVSSQLDCAFVTFRPFWRLFKSVAKFPSTFLFEILQNNQALWPVAQQRHRGQVYTLSGGWGHPSFLFFTSCSPFLHPWLQKPWHQSNHFKGLLDQKTNQFKSRKAYFLDLLSKIIGPFNRIQGTDKSLSSGYCQGFDETQPQQQIALSSCSGNYFDNFGGEGGEGLERP